MKTWRDPQSRRKYHFAIGPRGVYARRGSEPLARNLLNEHHKRGTYDGVPLDWETQTARGGGNPIEGANLILDSPRFVKPQQFPRFAQAAKNIGKQAARQVAAMTMRHLGADSDESAASPSSSPASTPSQPHARLPATPSSTAAMREEAEKCAAEAEEPAAEEADPEERAAEVEERAAEAEEHGSEPDERAAEVEELRAEVARLRKQLRLVSKALEAAVASASVGSVEVETDMASSEHELSDDELSTPAAPSRQSDCLASGATVVDVQVFEDGNPTTHGTPLRLRLHSSLTTPLRKLTANGIRTSVGKSGKASATGGSDGGEHSDIFSPLDVYASDSPNS